jgi:organic hydroperoxide reductase OsmC/OhrA
MEQEHFYNVSVSWDKDRIGNLSSPELNNLIEVATPPEFPKGVAGIWSPEHLLVAAVNSCLMTTFLSIAEHSRLEFTTFTSHAKGKLETVDGKLIISEIELIPVLLIKNESDKEKAVRILNKSEEVCLISNSIKSRIILSPEIKVTN